MSKREPEVTRGLIGVACTAIFAIYAFAYSDDAKASRSAAQKHQLPQVEMPTAADHTMAKHHLAKITRNDQHASTCMRRQILGGTEIHMAMNFAPVNRPATNENPGLARAHVKKANSKDKVLVIDSHEPTVWEVTGFPSAIIVLGKAVLGSYPDGTRIFAPRFASGCQNKNWLKPPKNWSFPAQQAVMDSLLDNLNNRFNRRAMTISTKMFNRPTSSWRAQRGETVMSF